MHVCESVIGGTGSYLAELIPHQVQRYGAENIALLIPKNQLQFIEQSILDAGPQIITFSRPMRSIGAMFLLKRYLSAVAEFKPDIVHAHSSVAGAIVRMFGRSEQFRLVFCPHGWSVDISGSRLLSRVAEKVERWLARFPDLIIVISKHEYSRALELGLPPERLALVANGIARIPPEVEPAEWNDVRIKVLFAGRFDYQKGVDILLRAVEGLEDRISVRLVGDFALSKLELPTPMPKGVERLGWLDREAVTAQMKSCDVLVVPSRWEGFGLVAIEAMRLSIPVLATSVGGLKEILGEGEFGYLTAPEDHVALQNALKALNKDDLKRMGAIGNRRFLSTYTSDRMVQQIDSAYSKIVEDTHYFGEIKGAREKRIG